MTVDTFSQEAHFEAFGRKTMRDHDLCPHCGKRGNKVDESDILWNERPKATDHDYMCASCGGEWVIRRYHFTGFEKYPHAPFAVIYVPMGGDPVEGSVTHEPPSGIDEIPF